MQEVILDAQTTAREFNNNLKRIFKDELKLKVRVGINYPHNWPNVRYVGVWTDEVIPNDIRKLAVLEVYGKLDGVMNLQDINYGNIQDHRISLSPTQWNSLWAKYLEVKPEPTSVVPDKIQKLVKALKIANEAAIAADRPDDGGSCNMDTATIKLFRWTQAEIIEVKRLSGIEIGDPLTGFFRNYRFVFFNTNGQADRRSRMANAAYKSLKEQGYDVMFWQQMD